MIVVVGSVNLDTVWEVDRHPKPGETVTAVNVHTADGGKGANQAVAVARLGGSVQLVAAIGDDAQSLSMREDLASEGVDVTHVRSIERARTGAAVIIVDAKGENSIVVSGGANDALVLTDDTRAVIAAGALVLVQLEVPIDTVTDVARSATGPVVLNAAPAASLPEELLGLIDVLIVNEHESAIALGDRRANPPTVITTLGASGVSVATNGVTEVIHAYRVDVVDTTGAGDAFCGAFAEAFARGEDVLAASEWAVAAGSLATTALGARAAMPSRRQMEILMKGGG